MPRAFVTGANGFLGLNLVEQLCSDGWEVVGLHLPGTATSYAEAFPVALVAGDITESEQLEAAMPEAADAVFHTAALTSIWSRRDALQTRINVAGTRNVARVALAKGARRLVHTSTWNTFGLGQREISEETPQAGARSWINYVRSKALAEEEVRRVGAEGLDAVILNPGHLIGRYDTHNWGRLIRMVDDGSLPGVPAVRSRFCHAEAVARAHVAAARRARAGETYLLPGVEASFREVLETIGRLIDKPIPKRNLPMPILRLVARFRVLKAALTGREPDLTPEAVALMVNDPEIVSDKAKRELGYQPAALETMVVDACTWMKEEGLLA
ncbi:MAG: NAD-dependent epimerase/dehydratase family protein [Kiloniellales bacterium]|nr:NAD-dependent epimerase/dehydratase family protein [Kiloniellales bacterium]